MGGGGIGDSDECGSGMVWILCIKSLSVRLYSSYYFWGIYDQKNIPATLLCDLQGIKYMQ